MSAIANSNHPKDNNSKPKILTFWHNIPWQKLTSLMLAIALCLALTACGGSNKPAATPKTASKPIETIKFTEVSPPSEIQRLSRMLDRYNPQVSILSPQPDQVLTEAEVAVKFDVKDLPIFKNAEFGLGPHIHVTLDNQEYRAVYDLNQAATFTNLSPGTHIIRAFASRPWHESFKNQGAYAQVSFNVLTKTDENNPDPQTPLLTYSRPVGTYGAEPIMLDFYIQNAPLHLLAQEDPAIDDWQVRATIDDQSFTFDRWEPIYLKGFKQGKNWIKLELLEEDGDAIANVFNSTAHLINYQPNGTDTLSRLVSGEKIANIEAIVDPDYVPPAPPEPAADAAVTSETETGEIVNSETATSAPATSETAIASPTETTPAVTTPQPEVKETVEELVKDSAKATPEPETAIAKPQEQPVTPIAQPKAIAPNQIKITPTSPKTSPATVVKPSTKPSPTNSPETVNAPIAKSPEEIKEKETPSKALETVKDSQDQTAQKAINQANQADQNQKPTEAAKTAPKLETSNTTKSASKETATENTTTIPDLSAASSTPIRVITK